MYRKVRALCGFLPSSNSRSSRITPAQGSQKSSILIDIPKLMPTLVTQRGMLQSIVRSQDYSHDKET